MKKKNVLFVVDERMMGGVSVVLNDLLHLLDLTYFNIDVMVLHNRGEMLKDLPNGVRLIFGTQYFSAIDYTLKEVIQKKRVSLFIRKLKTVYDLKTGRIKKVILNERKKCIHKEYDVEIAFKDGFTALFTAFGNTPNKIHWLHCAYRTFNPNEKYPALFHEALGKFQHIVGVTPSVVEEFNEVYHLEKVSEPIPVAMDIERIKKLGNVPPKVLLKENILQIAVIGRAHPVKGYDRMVEVLHQLHTQHYLDDVEVHMFGEGPQFHQIQQMILDFHLEKQVILEGQIDNPYAELKQYDFLLLPSYSEAFGTVIWESFILGIPVLSTRTSASKLGIKENKNGWECENTSKGLYEKLKEVLSNRKVIETCKQNLIDFQYNNEEILKRIHEILMRN